jgi:single-stranded DNA-binding protein
MDINLAVVSGTITNDLIYRELADGATIVQFDVQTTVERNERPVHVSVPVSWRDPAPSALAALAALADGACVVVVGRIERRFFRSGAQTQSRTELVAERCLPARRTKTVQSALAAAAATLGR